jgi:pyruvate dehydrogenase E2 component (dihydrolipoamide acetyltransferase)
MADVLRMPKIGVNMKDGRITEWLVEVGDRVAEGDTILMAETDKAVQEIGATASGRIERILVSEQETADCQQPIAVLAEPGEDTSELVSRITGEIETIRSPSAGVDANTKSDDAAGSDSGAGSLHDIDRVRSTASGSTKGEELSNAVKTQPSRVRISPLARKTAGELGINIRLLSPKTPGGRIVKEDVLSFVRTGVASEGAYAESGESGPAARPKDRLLPMTPIRRTIAEKMTESVTTIPQAILSVTVRAANLTVWRKSYADGGHRVSYDSLICKAVARALRSHPRMNSRLTGDGILIHGRIDVGIAVDTDAGLLVPVVRRADRLGVLEIEAALIEMAARARAGKATGEDLTGGTFTITNLGGFGIDEFIPLVNPPQCGILAVGRIVKEPVYDEDSGSFTAEQTMRLSLAFDHRSIDGGPAARFLSEVKRLLEQPLAIME